ncbi:hypothetical protein [Poritiphilus flavus]|uniref:Uncharacterized protein n=1 Tax=Poritiphilus flavus TaxID=2697053 RepID=A0A6L9E8G2_9FLAO|nr:hypothetical protein [Poritiphilus flavus]NAS11055.1 hypothetical protein [Poritiphilus flavus]
MESKKYLDDISEIKNMMNKSSRFISLSGLSGVMAGIYALGGAWLAHSKISADRMSAYSDLSEMETILQERELTIELLMIAGGVLVLALGTGILLSIRKAKREGEKIWNHSSKRLVINFFIPLLAGGLFSIAMLQYGYLSLVAPATLVFYGLACVNASKYTYGDVRYLGIANIVLGLIATQFVGYGLFFWAMGFGVLHILYGTLMYYRYDRAKQD